MSEFKGTPGPWCISSDAWVTDNDEDMAVAKISYYNREIDTQTANAHLIAAAPELLEALMDIINMEYEPNESDTTYLKARKAIAKALGETK